jgi:ribose transport system substrate-binding protein
MSHPGKKRGFWLTIVTAIIALFASACGQAPAAPQAPAQVPPGSVDTTRYKKDGPYTLCFSNASASNTWRLAMVEHVRYEVKQHPEIKTFRETDANDDPAKQISDIEGLMAQGCDALLASPATLEELKPAIDKVMARGVPVVLIDRTVSGDNYVSYISSNNCTMGRLQAQWLVKELNGKGDIVLLSGVKGSSVAEDRIRCAREVFAKNQGIKELAQGYANWSPVDGKKIMANWLKRYDKIDGIWADGSQGVGAVNAYLEAKKSVPPITGCDINTFMKQWKQNGFSAMAVTYTPRVGEAGVQAALDILAGKPVIHQMDMQQAVVTKDNLDQFVRLDLPDGYWGDSDPAVTKLMFPK